MKKSVIVAILVIYVLAIVIVGFIGIQMRIYNPVIYIDKIECVSDGYKPYKESDREAQEGFSGEISKTYTEGLRVLIKCTYDPADANAFKGKPFEYSAASKPSDYNLIEQDDGTCIVEFLKGGACCDIIVKAQDGSNKQMMIRVFAVPDKGKFF